MDLTEAQWKVMKKFIPQDGRREDRRGRPWSDQRRAFNGILWILRTGAPWQDLPERYGAYQTVQRRFQHLRKQGVIEAVLQGLARDLHKRGGLDLSECFVDGSFSAARPGGFKVGKTKRGKGLQNHGNWRRSWSSNRHPHRNCCARRSEAGGSHSEQAARARKASAHYCR